MLTSKQEKFVQNLIKGMSQREAYRDAYPSSKKWLDTSVDCEASKLFADTKVSQRYKELQEKASNAAIMSAIERKQWLSDVINNEQKEEVYIEQDGIEQLAYKKNADLNTKMKAMEMLNKMDGIYTTKIEGNVNISYEEALKSVSDSDDY